jgi:ATP/maltotriose-dependent transcriptional regulator MalT
VPRERLIDQLEPGRHRRLTLIHAPAGFGKTTLAAQWQQRLTAGGEAVAWLSIEPDDNRPLWLLGHLAEAIRKVRPGLGAELHAVLQDHPDNFEYAERYVLSTLVNEIDASGEPLVIVIDDWHRVSDPRTVAALELLLDTASPLLRLVVTSRTRSGLPLGRLRVRDQLVEIDATALRFDPAESTELLVGIEGLPLLDSDVQELHRTTDGWVTALQLAALSLRGPGPVGSLADALPDRPPLDPYPSIDAYLDAHVLDRQPAEMLDFLMKTALPERICVDLSIALTGRGHSLAMLEEIESEGLFLRPLDAGRVWFGYHDLFAGFLRRRLERHAPEQLRDLHRRAAGWFAEAGLTSEAVDHALAAGDPGRAVQIVADRAMPLVEAGRMASLLALAGKLPPVHAGDSPRLQLALGWAHCVLQRRDLARVALTHLERALAAGSLSGPGLMEDGDLVLECRLLRAAITIYSDRVEDADQLVAEILGRADELRPWLVSVAANMETVASLHRFDFAAVRSRQAWAEPFHERSGGPFFGVLALCRASIAALEQLDVPAAGEYLKRALERSSGAGGRRSYLSQVVLAQVGGLRYQLGELDAAEQYLDQASELGESGLVEFLLTGYVIAARVKAGRGDLPGAQARLAAGAEVAARLGLDRLGTAVIEEQARQGLPVEPATATTPGSAGAPLTGTALIIAENLEGARIRQALTGSPDPEPDLAPAPGSVQVSGAAPVSGSAHVSRAGPVSGSVPAPAPPGGWIRLVEAARDRLARIEAQPRPLAALRARVLLAAVLHRAGRTAEAGQCLIPALRRSAETGLVAPIAEGGAPVAELLAVLRAQQPPIDGLPDPLLHRFQQAAAPGTGAAAPELPSIIGALTPPPAQPVTPMPARSVSLNEREREILQLLAAGHTNQQIGHRMHLSSNTVKWYLKGLYPKFGVTRRQECVAVARAQGLLP